LVSESWKRVRPSRKTWPWIYFAKATVVEECARYPGGANQPTQKERDKGRKGLWGRKLTALAVGIRYER
jgi:hypothetical protein